MITTVKSIGRTVKVVQDGTANLKSEWVGVGERLRAEGSRAQARPIGHLLEDFCLP
jgi:hypothetical protein